MEFYHTCPENTHTDAHDTCQRVAEEISQLGADRTASALDRIIRNIKFADGGGAGLENASQLIYDLEAEFRGNAPALFTEAQGIRNNHNLPPLNCG